MHLRSSDLAIKVTPEIYRLLKSQAISKGLSIDQYSNSLLSEALLGYLEETLPLEDELSYGEYGRPIKGLEGKQFTDQGARAFSQAARYEFQKHSLICGIRFVLFRLCIAGSKAPTPGNISASEYFISSGDLMIFSDLPNLLNDCWTE